MKSHPLFFLLFTLAFFACKQQHVTKGGKAASHFASEADQRNFETAFYEGNKQMVLGNHNEAITQFKKCVQLDPNSDAAAYLLAKEYNITRKYAQSLPYAQTAMKLNDKNVWYHLLVADNLKHTDKNEEAAKVFEHVADKFKSYETYYFDAVESYVVAKKLNDAIHCLDKLEKITGVNEEICFKKEDIFLKQSKKDPAIAELQKLISAFPTRIRYKVALAEVYYGFGEEVKGDEMLKKVMAVDPQLPEAHLLLANKYRSKGENEKAFEELKIVFSNPDADIKQKLEILTSYLPMLSHSEATRIQALELGSLLSKAHPNSDACNLLYADILYNCEKYGDARFHYLIALQSNKSNFNLWQNLLQCEDDLKLYDEAIKYADEALETFPNQAVFYYYKSYFAYRLKDYTTAAKTAKLGFDVGSERTQLILQLLSIQADANNALKNYELSDDAYEKLLALDPNNLQALNNYSYYLSLRKVKLEKAESMSKKTLEIDPNNASYADTYGWILYQQKKYSDARIFVEKALMQQPSNGVLNEHLGDIYFQLNDIDKALTYWKKAKDNGNDSPSLTQKINNKKLVE